MGDKHCIVMIQQVEKFQFVTFSLLSEFFLCAKAFSPDICAADVAPSADELALVMRFVCSCCLHVQPRRPRLCHQND